MMNDTNGAAVLEGPLTEQDLPQNSGETQKLHHATFESDIETLLNQIDQGLRADDATNFEKLTIARTYGPLLLQLKEMVPHGQFKKVLKERFPRVSYSKCNRWMVIARHEVEVAEALVAYPDVAWGPKKIIDFLTKEWSPQEGSEVVDEEDCWGLASESFTAAESENDVDADFNDLDEESDERAHWEELAAKAESEARLLGEEPVAPFIAATLSVTVFSQQDHDAFQDGLARWQPRSVSIYGRPGSSVLTSSVPSQEISDVLLALAATLKKSVLNQLKLSVEL